MFKKTTYLMPQLVLKWRTGLKFFFGLNVFSVTEQSVYWIYLWAGTWTLPFFWYEAEKFGEFWCTASVFFVFFSCVECLARRIRQTPSSAASLPVFIWKQMNWICCFLVLTSLQKKYINKYLKKKKFLWQYSYLKHLTSPVYLVWSAYEMVHL